MGQRGPKPLPTNVHLLRGNASKKPLAELLGDGSIRPEVEIPEPPAILGGEALAEWQRITPHLERLGLVSHIDRAELVSYCLAWADLVWARERIRVLQGDDDDGGRIMSTPSGYRQIGVHQQIANRAAEMVSKLAASFGMTPSARARVTASPQLGLPGLEAPAEGGWGDFT